MPYSIFLSHNAKDKSFVRRLAADLKAVGVTVWLDEGQMKLGDSLISKIEAGIKDTDFLGVILSPNSVASPWVQREVNIALTREISGKRVAVLPILYRNCDVPPFLMDKIYADFTDESKYLDSLNQIFDRLEVKSRQQKSELFLKNCVEEMGFKYSSSDALPSIHGIIEVPKRAHGRIAVHLRTDKNPSIIPGRKGNVASLHLDPREIMKWKLFGLPVIVVWVCASSEDSNMRALWQNANLSSSRTGRLRIPEKNLLGSKDSIRRFKNLTKHAWAPKLVSLKEQALFLDKVSEVRSHAWNYYRSWRAQEPISPVFGRVEITRRGWRHMTRHSLSQKAIIHKLSLLPFAKELVETSRKSRRVRVVPELSIGWMREFHALSGVYMSKHQADIAIEVILEVQRHRYAIQRVRFLSVQEKRNWTV